MLLQTDDGLPDLRRSQSTTQTLRRASPSTVANQSRPNPYGIKKSEEMVFRVRTLVRPSSDGQSLMGKGFVVACNGELSRHQLRVKARLVGIVFCIHKKAKN